MAVLIQRILTRFGQKLTLLRADKQEQLYGMIQPSRSKSLQNMGHDHSLLGQLPDGQYVYLGPAEPQVAEGDVIVQGNSSYILRRAEEVWYQGSIVYCWGLCVRKDGDGV